MLKTGLKFKSKNVATDKRPCFFKLLHSQLPAHFLRIPSEFRKHIHEDLPQTGRLRVLSEERIWSIRVVKEGNEIYIEDGWSKFIQDNSSGNEFLQFTYEGNLSFKVEIFDLNGVKRLRRSDPGTSQLPQVQRNVQEQPLQQCQNASKFFTSEFPFFERCMKSYNIQKTLNIPTNFARKYFPAEKTELVLRNQKGKAWKVTYAPYDTNWSFYRGWRNFVRDNKLKEDDICIFELVGERKLKVYIYRS